MSVRYINADELLNDLQPLFVHNGNLKDEWLSYCVEKTIREQPIADVVEVVREVVRGEWVEDIAYYDEDGCPCIVTRCSNCGEAYPTYNYCPNCGAKMDERRKQ